MKDFAKPEEELAEHKTKVTSYANKNKARKENYIRNLKKKYGTNVTVWLSDKPFLEVTVVRGLPNEDKDHWAIKDRHKGVRSRVLEIVSFQRKTEKLRDNVGKIIR